MIDLHVHSTCSDGALTPEALVEEARRVGLHAIALTDHDTVEGVPAFLEACRAAGIRGVAGVEISIDHSPGAFHLLGYHLDPLNSELIRTLRWISQERERRNRGILDRLARLGIPLTMEEVLAEVSDDNVNVGRPHVAAAMLRKGYVSDIQEAFSLYLAKGKPAYVPRGKLGPEDGIALIRQAGGIPVLAHPFTLEDCGGRPLRDLVAEWTGAGLQGIECIYPEHGPRKTRRYRDLAREYGLVVTGGTDFHGPVRPGIGLGVGSGSFRVPDEILDSLDALRGL